MKVYWSEDQVAVITSANLSINVLSGGRSGLKEIGVLLPPGEVDIERIIASLRSRRVFELELEELERKINHSFAVLADRGCAGQTRLTVNGLLL